MVEYKVKPSIFLFYPFIFGLISLLLSSLYTGLGALLRVLHVYRINEKVTRCKEKKDTLINAVILEGKSHLRARNQTLYAALNAKGLLRLSLSSLSVNRERYKRAAEPPHCRT